MLKKKKTTASGKLVLVKRAWGRCPQQASGEENHGGIFFSAGLCVLTQALLASFLRN